MQALLDWFSAIILARGDVNVTEGSQLDLDALLETAFIQYSFRKYERCLETLERAGS